MFTFLKFFDNPLSKYLISKRISCMPMAVLGYLPLLKRGVGLTFCAHFLHNLLIKVSYLVFYLWTKFQWHTFFPSQDIKQNVLLSTCLDNWWCHKLKNLSSIILKSNGRQGKKRGRRKYKNFNISRTERAF